MNNLDNKNGFTSVIFVVGVLLIGVVVVGGFLYFNKAQLKVINPHTTKSSQETESCYYTGCLEDFVCNESRPGGLTPEGPRIGKISGDGKCHKRCVTNKDCPQNTPICVSKTIAREDIANSVRMCFTQGE